MTLTDPRETGRPFAEVTAADEAAVRVVRLDLTGRTAMVTGAGSGIGRAVATRLALAGAAIVALDVNAAAAVSIADEIGATPLALDLSDAGAINAYLSRTVADRPTIVVNSAGLQHVAPLPDFSAERFTYLQRVMVEAPFRLVQNALPAMYDAGWGRVVNISSVHGLRASPLKAAYVAAKHGLEGLTKVIALEGAPHGVTANCISPGYVRTPLVQGQIADQAAAHGIAESEVIEQILLTRSAMKRLIEPAEVAELVAYLCSPAADFITGSSITLDGGWTAS